MENILDHIDELIGKYLAGEATADEQRAVDAWVKADAANRKYFEDMQTIFDRASSIQQWQQFDTDAAWNKVKDKLHTNGKVVSIKHSGLSWYMRIAASVLALVVVGYLVYRITDKPVVTMAVATEEQVLQDTLPDGSTTFLNKTSSIAYQYNPREKVRRVKLVGEAYFDVKHEEEKPFIIETEEIVIEDIGTTFNVKAYPESNTVEVFVETGEVAFYTNQNPGVRLVEGETGIYDKTSKTFSKYAEADTNVLAYKTRVFHFANADLGTIVESLNAVYEKKIRLSDDRLRSCRINVSFTGEPIETIADIIAETLNFKITTSEKEILLEGSGCGE